MAEGETAAEVTIPPQEQPVTTTPAAQSAAADATAALVEEVRRRVARSNYGVSAKLGITLLDRGDHGLLLFEADEHQEALRAASAALATTPDGDARVWRFVGSGPDLETGRYRAVVRVDGVPSGAREASSATDTATARVAPE